MRPRRGHVRLVLYFALLGATAAWLGILGLKAAASPSERERVLLAAVFGALALAAIGVVYHRLRVIRARWTETEQYLARIEAQSAKYRALLEGAADMLLLLDGQSLEVLEDNANARAVLGLQSTSARADPLQFVAADDLPRLRATLEQAQRFPGPPSTALDVRLLTPKGSALIVDVSVAGIDLKPQVLLLLSLRDRTAQKDIERQLRIHERLSSLGLLTAGVAHEINNPLEGIGNYLSLLEREGLTPEQRARYLAAVHHGFDRIREIAKELLRFARPRRDESVADVAQVVQGALTLVRLSEKLKPLTIELDGMEAGLVALADPGQLEQVLVNLLMNAGQAAQPAGKIHVQVGRVPGSKAGAPEIEIVVTDDGPGIPAQALEHLFDPFFSASGGTGLGLAISYSLASAMGGTIQASNLPVRGARFVLRIPAQLPTP